MIDRVSISNFKVLKGIKNVDFNKITLLGGKNNAGKTTFLEALFATFNIKSPDVFLRLLLSRRLNFEKMLPSSVWEPFFSDFELAHDIKIAYSIGGTNNSLEISHEKNYVPRVPIPVNNEGILRPGIPSSTGYQALNISHKNEHTEDYSVHTVLHSGGMHHFVELDKANGIQSVFYMLSTMIDALEAPELLGRLDKNDDQQKVVDIMRLFENNLQRFQLIKEGRQDILYADLGMKRKIPVAMFGTGFCRCLLMALLLAAGEFKTLLIDEIENGIHHSLLGGFWKFLIRASQEFDCQIIATTHSAEMIAAFCEESQAQKFKEVSYIRLAKEGDNVSAYQFDYDDLSSALDSEMEVR
jgi:AAA15 family ATPase/GTPase